MQIDHYDEQQCALCGSAEDLYQPASLCGHWACTQCMEP